MNRKSTPTRTLRQRPDIDQLRRQAKELLEAFVSGETKAVAEVNTHYDGADPTNFALHDAQLVLARAHGFDSWPKLKAHVDRVTVQDLADAVTAGDMERVRSMIKARPELVNMDMAENNEHHPLHFAVFARSPQMVRLLMASGGNARAGVYPHRDATTPLAIAEARGYDELVAIIHEEEQRRRAPEVNSAQDDLIEIIAEGEHERALAILEHDPARGNAADRRGWTPLHAAARALDERLVEWLLDRGADPNQPGPGGRTPIDVADGRGWHHAHGLEPYDAVVHLLLARGAVLTPRAAVALGEADWIRARHAEGNLVHQVPGPGGLLGVAVRHDRPEMLSMLLDFGFDPDERTRLDGVDDVHYSSGFPLHLCAGLGKREMAEILLERGANPNAEVYASGSVMYSALHAHQDEMVKLLERYGGFVDAATAGHLRLTEKARQMFADQDAGRLRERTFTNESLEWELLWGGLRGGDPEIVRMSLERVDWPRNDERWFYMLWSPLPDEERREEEHRKFFSCFRQVLDRADPNIRHLRFGRTVLHDVAASAGELVYAEALLDAGASLTERDDLLKTTPLGWACRWGRLPMVKLLLERGADPVEADAEPWARPRAWAERMGHRDVLLLLG